MIQSNAEARRTRGGSRRRDCAGSRSKVLVFAFLSSLTLLAQGQPDYVTCPIQPPGVTSITVMDRQGRYVGRILPQKRYWVPIDRIPAFLQQALLAVEDARFYEHGGVDFRGIARALLKDAVKGRLAEGGSTITQQLIKNKFLTSEPTLDRKLKEARMAVEFEKKYTKRQILEMYFNEIYYGNGARGIAQAARLYFNKGVEDLNEGECLLLAGIPKNPSRYNPLANPVPVAERREVVLKRLVDLGLISSERRQWFREHPAAAVTPGQAPGAVALVRARLAGMYGEDILEKGGLDVFAALDLDLQKQAERAVREGVRRIAPDLQGALVCLDAATGDLLAAVGDAEGVQNGLNRAFVSRRQPGSAIKPLLYAAALERGVAEAGQRWNDDPVAYPKGNGETWRPRNYANERFGEIPLREALAHSDNIIAVKLLDALGVPAFTDFAARLGLALPAANGLSLALGTGEVTLGDLVQAYTPFAAGGLRVQARPILRIHDRAGGAWTEIQPVAAPVLDSATAYITTWMLEDVLREGTAKALRGFQEEHPCAGKTGTTEDFQDAWFVGYTPRLVTGVWVGWDTPRSGGRGFTGGAVAAPIWARFMGQALGKGPGEAFPRPATVVEVALDPANGCLATPGCPETETGLFAEGTEPAESCPLHSAQNDGSK